jgi:hypothetical protein
MTMQLDHLKSELSSSIKRVSELESELGNERKKNRKRNLALADELSRAIQHREQAAYSLRKFEENIGFDQLSGAQQHALEVLYVCE